VTLRAERRKPARAKARDTFVRGAATNMRLAAMTASDKRFVAYRWRFAGASLTSCKRGRT
jgi:hypothetical protein